MAMNKNSILLPVLILGCLASAWPDPQARGTQTDSGRTSEGPVIALVLEGGGALGLAHIGVIETIEALGIPIDLVVGTSMGAIVGGLYAVGYDSEELEAIALEADWLELFSEYQPSRSDSFRTRELQSRFFASVPFDRHGLRGSGGLLSGMKILTYMDCLVSGVQASPDFDALPRRYRAVATDISTGEAVVLGKGSISDAMRASMGIPGVFAPHVIDGRYLLDGGIVNNLPVDVARDLGADIIIAVELVGGFEPLRRVLDRSPLDYLARTLDIMIQANVEEQIPGADLIIQIDLQDYTVMDFARSRMIIDQGRLAAKDNSGALADLRDRIQASGRQHGFRTSPDSESASGTGPSPFSPAFHILGGTKQDQAALRRLLLPSTIAPYTARDLAKSLIGLYRERPIAGLRLRQISGSPIPGGETEAPQMLVELEPRNMSGNHLMLGLNYASTYSDRTANRMTVTPGLQIRGWPLPDTEITMNLELLNTLRFETTVHQGIMDLFFLRTDISFRHEYRILNFSSEDTPGVGQIFYRTASRVGTSLGLYPFSGGMIFLGLTREWNQDGFGLDIPAYLLARDIAVVQLGAGINRTDSLIFPMDGITMDLRASAGLSLFGADSTFRTATARGGAFLSLASPVSVGILWKAGLDFSEILSPGDPAPLAYKPSLGDRRLFPALLTADEQLGMAVLGAGLELKLELDRLSEAIGIPAFVLIQGSAGSARQDVDAFAGRVPPLYWNVALGAGIRASEAFGLSLRAGAAARPGGRLVPYFALDLGAIGRMD